MTDLKNICCNGQSVLGVDKTFNLCDMHVTATCFKQNAVVRDDTGESPIFWGPLFIHDNSDFDTYSTFFNHLRTKLMDTDTTKLVIGSDEKLPMQFQKLLKIRTTSFVNGICTKTPNKNLWMIALTRSPGRQF